MKKGVLRNLTKFPGKHLKPEAYNFIEKETLAQMFSCEFCEISKNNFFTEHFWTTASISNFKHLTIALKYFYSSWAHFEPCSFKASWK